MNNNNTTDAKSMTNQTNRYEVHDKPDEWMRGGRMDVKIMNNNATETQRCEGHDKPDERTHGDVKFMTNQVNRCEVHNKPGE